jgi:hypothetical protein
MKAPIAVVDNEHTDPVKMVTEEALDTFFAAAPHFRNQLYVWHEEQDEEKITFPDFELVACEKCQNLTSDDTLIRTCSSSSIVLLRMLKLMITCWQNRVKRL